MNLWQRIKVAVFWNRYDATGWSDSRSWRSGTLQDARLDLTKATREVLQAKSREWERNSELYWKLANTWEQYTVGTGIRLASASSDPEWNKAADEAMDNWEPLADLQSRFGWYNDQGIIARARFVDGEHFILLTREGPFPRIQLIEAHQCRTPDSLLAHEGSDIIDGRRVDENGRPIAYYLNGEKPPEDASHVIHVMNPGRASQPRGIPECTSALNTIHDLYDLKTLTMKAAKDAEELSTVYKTATGEMPTNMANMVQRFKDANTASGASSNVTDARREYYQNAKGGRNMVLFQGDDVSQHIPARPGAETREYWRLLAGEVCAAAGIPLALVYPDSMQGTVYRGSLDAAAAGFRNETAVLSGYFARVRNYVIESEAARNPKLAKKPADWKKVTPGTVRAPNVDVGRNSQAILAELAAGTRTFCSVAAELGLDGKQLLRDKASEAAYIAELAKEFGVTPQEISDRIPEAKPKPFGT